MASGSIISAGAETVSSGGVDLEAQIFGGKQDVSGYASGVTLFGGSQLVESGGTADNTLVTAAGLQDVTSGGFASGTVIAGNGTQDVETGGTATETAINGNGAQEVEFRRRRDPHDYQLEQRSAGYLFRGHGEPHHDQCWNAA